MKATAREAPSSSTVGISILPTVWQNMKEPRHETALEDLNYTNCLGNQVILLASLKNLRAENTPTKFPP